MIDRAGDARAWLAWAAAATFLAMATRNPITLGLLLLVVLAVGLRLLPRRLATLPWRSIAGLVAGLSLITILFNVLITRAGDSALLRLPETWPLIGGALTLNALVYGAVTAMGLLALVGVWAIVNVMVDHAALLRWLPPRLHAVGVAVSIALTMLPTLLQALSTIREAQLLRGLQPTGRLAGLRSLPAVAGPLLTLGLERGLGLAESLEARGFGHQPRPTRYRQAVWRLSDSLMVALAGLAVAGLLLARLLDGPALAYSVYPTLSPPLVSGWSLAAVLLLLGPALAAEADWP